MQGYCIFNYISDMRFMDGSCGSHSEKYVFFYVYPSMDTWLNNVEHVYLSPQWL